MMIYSFSSTRARSRFKSALQFSNSNSNSRMRLLEVKLCFSNWFNRGCKDDKLWSRWTTITDVRSKCSTVIYSHLQQGLAHRRRDTFSTSGCAALDCPSHSSDPLNREGISSSHQPLPSKLPVACSVPSLLSPNLVLPLISTC